MAQWHNGQSKTDYAYMRGGAAWGMLTVKADMVLFAGNTV